MESQEIVLLNSETNEVSRGIQMQIFMTALSHLYGPIRCPGLNWRLMERCGLVLGHHNGPPLVTTHSTVNDLLQDSVGLSHGQLEEDVKQN